MCFIQLRKFLYVPSLLKFFLGIDAELCPVPLLRWLCWARSGRGSLCAYPTGSSPSSLDMWCHVFLPVWELLPSFPLGSLPTV